LRANPFYGRDGRRAIADEILAELQATTGCTMVMGLDDVLEAGDARVGSKRISGFAERHQLGEWLLPLSAEKGLVWRTAPVPEQTAGKVAFALSLGFGNGSPLPQPSGQFDIYVNDRFALACRVVNHSQLWKGEACALAFAARRCETAAPYAALMLSDLIQNEMQATLGPALLSVPSDWVQPGKPATIRVEARCPVPSTRWLQIDQVSALLAGTHIDQAAALLAGERPTASGYNLYFGDIHTHSGQVVDVCEDNGCGLGTRESNYAYAEGPGGLDFYCLSDHEWQIDPDDPSKFLGLADTHNKDGAFVCIPGYEFTNLLWGHRNVYFRDTGGTVINTNRTPGGGPTKDPALCIRTETMWEGLEAHGVPFLTVPHHPSATSHPMTWEVFDPRYDRLVEVYSCWGSSAYYGDFPRGVSDRYSALCLQKALAKGLRFGMIGSADGHDGHPGNAQSGLVKHHHTFHFCGSGRAVVLTSELTREAVWDALYARRCYATTGTPIALDVTLNGAVMGSERAALAIGDVPRLSVNCVGSNGIDQIRVIKNGRVVYCELGYGSPTVSFEWQDPSYDRAEPSGYYVRVVQVDHESAWSSPIWLG